MDRAIGEAAKVGINFLPLGGQARAIGSLGIPALMGLLRREAASGAESLASRSASLYNPPVKSPRPFAADYPSGAPADAIGRLTADIEGRPLVAQHIVGRRTLGGADEAFTPAEIDAVTQAVVGKYPESVAASALPRDALGAYVRAQGPHRIDRGILVRRDLPADVKDKVAAHELSHAIGQFAGDIVGPGQVEPTRMIPRKPGMPSELKTVYNDLNNSYLAKACAQNPDIDPAKVHWGTGVTPEKTFGYAKADAPAEHMSEAVRAYLADPNYLRREAASGAESLASRSVSLYNPPIKSSRPFAADYPSGAPADAAGRLAADIEGRPLVAQYIVGRRTLGGADEALTPTELDAVVQEAIGAPPEAVTARALPRGTVGGYRIVPGSEKIERSIVVRGDLPPDLKDKIVAHEAGHMIEDLAGAPRPNSLYRAIPQDRLKTELRTIYNDLNNSYLAKARAQNPDIDPAKVYWGTGVTPEKTFGYAKADAPAEYIAEAIRAYMADPNYGE
jgi:hypothetical protein